MGATIKRLGRWNLINYFSCDTVHASQSAETEELVFKESRKMLVLIRTFRMPPHSIFH